MDHENFNNTATLDPLVELVNQVVKSLKDQTFPFKPKTKEMCTIAVQYDYNALSHFFWWYESLELDEIAVYCDPNALFWMSDKYKTPEICKKAIDKIPYLAKYVPKHILDIIHSQK